MEALYVKIRGRTLGPFDEDKLLSMVQKGQLSRVHQVSTDKENWKKAGEFVELFASRAIPKEGGQQEKSTSAAPAPNPVSEWYYGDGKNPIGPIPSTEIRNLLAADRINDTTLVWREGFQDWVPISSLEEFLAPPQKVSVEIVQKRRQKKEIEDPESSGEDADGDQIRALQGSRGWMLLVATTLIVLGVLGVLSGCIWLVAGIKASASLLLLTGISSIVWGGLMIYGCTILFSISSKIYKLQFRRSEFLVWEILEDYRHLWVFLGIIAIVFIAWFLLAMFFTLAAGNELSNFYY